MGATLFTNGALFDGHRYVGPGELLVRDGRIVETGRGLDRDEAEVVDVQGGLIAPGFVDAHVHPIQGGLERLRCDLSEYTTREEYLAVDRGVRRRPSRGRVDPRRRLGDAGLPGRHPAGRRPRHRGAGPAGLPAEPGPPRCVGQLEGAGARRGRPAHPGSARRSDRARRRRQPERDPPRGRDQPGVPPPAAYHRRGLLRGPDGGPGLPALGRRHVVAGRDRRRLLRHGRPRVDVRRRGRERRPALPRGRRAVVGATPGGGADPRPRRPPRGDDRCPLPRHVA